MGFPKNHFLISKTNFVYLRQNRIETQSVQNLRTNRMQGEMLVNTVIILLKLHILTRNCVKTFCPQASFNFSITADYNDSRFNFYSVG